jgi:hypothetical protein
VIAFLNLEQPIQTLFTFFITLQFFVVVLHDLVDIPGWTHGSQVKSVVGPRTFWLGTLINAIFPGVAVSLDHLLCRDPGIGDRHVVRPVLLRRE